MPARLDRHSALQRIAHLEGRLLHTQMSAAAFNAAQAEIARLRLCLR